MVAGNVVKGLSDVGSTFQDDLLPRRQQHPVTGTVVRGVFDYLLSMLHGYLLILVVANREACFFCGPVNMLGFKPI